jgi:hypothetical protein
MVLDINKEGRLIGIELLAPELVTLEAVNSILEEYGFEPLKESGLAPLLAAQPTSSNELSRSSK